MLKGLLILLFGQKQRPVHDLRKQEQKSLSEGLGEWVQMNYTLFALVLIPVLLVLFILLCYAICGVSATESGAVYNGFGKVI